MPIDSRMELVNHALKELQLRCESGLASDQEKLAFDALLALKAMLHDVATAGARASQHGLMVERDRQMMASMLHDFAEWSKLVQALMLEAADELELRRFGHVHDPRDAVRIAAALKRAVAQVKDPEDLDPEGSQALVDTSHGPLSGLALIPGGRGSGDEESS